MVRRPNDAFLIVKRRKDESITMRRAGIKTVQRGKTLQLDQGGEYETIQVDRIYVIRRMFQPVWFHIHQPVYIKKEATTLQITLLIHP